MRLKAFLSNSSGILASRIFGFIRDLLMASILGANIFSDIFFVAFKLPNLFRRIFAEGAFSQTFIPSFSASKNKIIFATKIFISLFIVVIILSILVNIFSVEVTKLIAPGFDSKTILMSAKYVAIEFWYLPLIFATTFLASLLQYKEHFATTAFSTLLLNISLIAALLLFQNRSKEELLFVLSISVLIGGALQLIAHLIAIKYFKLLKILTIGFRKILYYKNRAKEDTTRFLKNFFPAIWGNSTAQIMAFLDTWLASFLTAGSISYLYYGNRIFQLPLALFAIAMSTSIFPTVAKKINQNRIDDALREFKSAFWFLLILLGAATIIGIIFSKEIIYILFERGEFTHKDTINTSFVLSMYLIGLIPFGISKLLSLWLYSFHKQLVAAKIATYSLIVYSIFAILLIEPLKAAGLALAGSISGSVNLIFLIKNFGIDNFKYILSDKKMIIFTIFLLAILTLLALFIHKYISALLF